VGPTRTVPPDPPATPRTRRQLDNEPLDLDRPPATPPLRTEPTTPVEGRPLPAISIDATDEEYDLIGDLLAPEPLPRRAEVIDSRLEPPEPLGRRTPEPPDANREGVQR
jgi:hypothetical protein